MSVYQARGVGDAPGVGEDTEVVDLAGRMVLPGLHDSHIHVHDTGRVLGMCDLSGATSIANLQQRLRDYADAHPTAKWIIGRGWEQDKLGRCVVSGGLPVHAWSTADVTTTWR